MGRRLKQIKTNNLGASAKKVVDSLLIVNEKKGITKEESHEQMRCKVEILEGSVKKILIDSFVVNTASLNSTISSITEKFGENVQFKITNLFDEKLVAKRLTYTGGFSKEKDDKEHFVKQMDTIRKIQKMRDEGKDYEETRCKYAFLAGDSYIRKIYDSTEDQMILLLQKDYNNQSLGKLTQSDINIISKDLNTNKDIVIEDKENITKEKGEENINEE